jgi:hypothetical protein
MPTAGPSKRAHIHIYFRPSPLPIAKAFADANALHVVALHLGIHDLAMLYLGITRTEAVRHYVMIAFPMPAPFIGTFRVPVVCHELKLRLHIKIPQFPL